LSPAKSQAQRGYLAHKFGPAWMKKHGYDNPGKLPYKVGKKSSKPKTKARQKAKAKKRGK
jgi:hypothetical protein